MPLNEKSHGYDCLKWLWQATSFDLQAIPESELSLMKTLCNRALTACADLELDYTIYNSIKAKKAAIEARFKEYWKQVNPKPALIAKGAVLGSLSQEYQLINQYYPDAY